MTTTTMTPANLIFSVSLFKSELKRLGVRVYSVRKKQNGWSVTYCYELGNNTLSVKKTILFYADSLFQVYEQHFLN